MTTDVTLASNASKGSVAPTSLGEGHARRFASAVPTLDRRTNKVAEESTISARLEAARASGDLEAERGACLELARLLEVRGIGLGGAAQLYGRAADIRAEADVLRKRASLEEKLGRPALAADALGAALDLDAQPGGRVRLGWLLLRAGDNKRASEAFARAAAETNEPLATELRGALGFAGTGEVSRKEGADLYIEAAARRAGADQGEAELDDLARAFALSSSPDVAHRIALALERRGHEDLADAFLEGFVLSLPVTERADEIAALRTKRMRRGDVAGALLLALAPGERRDTDTFDDLLLRAGLPEVLAAHLALRAAASPPEERVPLLIERMRLLAGPLSDPRRALHASAEVLSLVPDESEALARLAAYADDGVSSLAAVATFVERIALGEGPIAALGEAVARLGDATDNPALSVVALRASLRSNDDPARRSRLANCEASCEERLDPKAKTSASGARARAIVLGTLLDRREELSAELSSLDGHEEHALDAWTLAVERLLAVGDTSSAVDVARVAVSHTKVGTARDAAVLLQARCELARGTKAAALVALMADGSLAPSHAPLALLLALDVGDSLALAQAATQLCDAAPAQVVATLRRVASRAFAAASDFASARRFAALARTTDPKDLRAAALDVDVHLRKRVGPENAKEALAAVESASAMLWPDARRVEMLASLAEAAGDLPGALAYGQRLIGMRPADPAPLAAFLDRLCSSKDTARIAESLGWILSLPYPASLLAESLVTGIAALSHDPERQMIAARRAFDVLGPSHAHLREALIQAGKASKSFSFSASVLERALSCGDARGGSDAPGAGYAALADLYAGALDGDGEVRALVSALRDGAVLEGLDERLARFSAVQLGGDAEVAWLDVLAERAPTIGAAQGALALRRLGAALWDLAADRSGALAAWLDAARLAPFRGYTTLRRDLVVFAGHEEALECLVALAEHEPDASRCGSLLAEAARVAAALDDPARAFDLASRALRQNPAHTDALTSAEAGSRGAANDAPLSALYSAVAAHALGRFGRRAAHYRAARFFESSGAFSLAVEHATAAFLAVPSEGSALQLLSRAGASAGDPAAVFQAVDRLASGLKSAAQRAAWLVRAAGLGDVESGVAQRTDALLRAFVLVPDARTLEMLAHSLRLQFRETPAEVDGLVLRFSRATRTVLPKCEGPEGARVAVRVAELADELGKDLVLAWDAIDRAFQCDGDIDEYKSLVGLVPRLVGLDGARAAFARAVAVSEKPYSSLGCAAFSLLGAFATRFGEALLARKFLVAAAIRDADDDVSVVLADEALLAHPDDGERRQLARHVPDARLAEALLNVADADRARGEHALELRRITRAQTLLPAGLPEAATARLELLAPRASGPRASSPSSPSSDLAVLSRAAQAAEDAGHHALADEALEKIANAPEADSSVRIDALLRLGRSSDAQDPDRAEGFYRRVAALAPDNEEADVAVEDLLTRARKFEPLAEHLALRVVRLSEDPLRSESLRALRLRMAALLEQRLGRPNDARAELEALLATDPNCVSALRYLADLAERNGDLTTTVAVLERIRALDSADVDTRNEAEVRIARIRFDAGNTEEARALVTGVLARGENLDATRLRVDIARHMSEPRELGDALASFARAGAEDAEVRSEILVEAAQAAARAGDVDVSLRRAQEAARVAPQVASVQLFARGLEYRTRGAGSPDDARMTVASLSQVRSHLMPADVALRAFLMSEASRAISGGAAGLELLLETRAELGPHALLALGTAERLAAQGRHEDALVAFDEAIAGPLLGMRRASEVHLSASVSAEKTGDLSLALRHAEAAVKEPDLRLAALERVRRLAFAFGDLRKQRSALRQLVAMQQGDLRIEAMKDLAGTLLSSDLSEDKEEGRSLLDAALRETPRGRALGDEIRAWLERLDQDALDAKRPPDAVAESLNEAQDNPSPEARAADAATREVLKSTMVSSGQGTDEGARHTRPLGPFVELAPNAALLEAPPSAREALSSGDIQEERVIPKAPPLPNAPIVAMPASLALEGTDPFPEHAFTTRDPFPAPVAGLEVPRGDTPSSEPVPEGEPTWVGHPLVVLPSLAPHVFDGIAKGALPDGPSVRRLAEGRASLAAGRAGEAELLFAEALAGGSAEAADLLASVLEGQPDRAGLYLRACRFAAELAPGDTKRLATLRRAALADNNSSYGRALDHLGRFLEGDPQPAEPPPLHQQTEQPGMLALLTRTGREGIGEAFGLVWEHAASTFVRSSAASMSGLERVQPGQDSVAGRILEATARLLGLTSARLSRRHVAGATSLSAHVALASPPSGILHGRGDEAPSELAFVIGRALGASLPHHALLLGQSEADARNLFRAMLGAFGPPEAARDLDRATATLGEILWQTLPAKAQRRLTELLVHATPSAFDDALARAQQAALRVGLFVSGDFREATRAVLRDLGQDPRIADSRAVMDLVGELPALSDLYRLATRPEYADARFSVPSRTGRPGQFG